MNKEIIEDLMDKYAKGNLTTTEQQQLDEIVLATPDIKKELIIRKDIVKSVEYLDRKDLLQMIEKIHHEEIEKPRSKFGWPKVVALLAFIIASILILFYILPEDKIEPTRLYAAYYKAYEPITPSRGDDSKDVIDIFKMQYSTKKYQSALKTITPTLDNQDSEIVVMAAVAAIETNDLTSTYSLLDKIIKAKDYYYSDHARWYRAMAFIKESKMDEAKLDLIILSNDSAADHHKEAAELLSKL